MSPETELAWAAGFYDGEGSTVVIVNQNGYKRVRISISQASLIGAPEVLKRFLEAVGCGNLRGPYTRTNKNAKPYWIYALSGKKAMEVIEKLWPFLGQVKKDQIIRCVDEVSDGNNPRHARVAS